MFIKLGEPIQISGVQETSSSTAMVNAEVLENFRKFAANLKRIAPKAEDFLYFSTVMLHAAEASAVNDDGTPKRNPRGEVVVVGWDDSNGTLRWKTNDPSIKPYANSNHDIFPEAELIKAHKKWVGKPLCIDHKSSSVDHVRGFIVDTYYDRINKRVIGLCALDKQNYPDLARKVSTGYSNDVSMGTAVGRAICTDCATVARNEHEFCDHMRRKSSYGEINVDLSPIELSIVVNGADPKAKIKHIIAAAQTLNSYVESKEKEFNKLADRKYTASLSFKNEDGEGVNSSYIDLESTDLDSFKNDIDKALEQLSSITSSIMEENLEKDTNDIAFNQPEDDSNGEVKTANDSSIEDSSKKYASETAEALKGLRQVTESIETKLSHMKHSLDKLHTHTSKIQEENMSGINKKGYYQGTEEPTPGRPQYAKDPMSEKIRDTQDKHMVGQMDLGPVDGMHPGPDSVSMSELDRKKMLARAESEDRAMRRQAVVTIAKKALEDKKAYWQGGGGVNEPTPGKIKYPAEKLNEDARDQDKHMVGQKPFPGVGAVDGLHPSPASADVADELKRKQMLSRAEPSDLLRGKFAKSYRPDGSLDTSKSAWNIFKGDTLILTASVGDLLGNRAEMLFDKVATKEFGSQLISKVKSEGADKVRSFIKSAQVPPAAPAPAPAPAAPEAAPAEDAGGSGDTKDSAVDLSEKVRDLSSDLVEAVRALTGEQAEMGEMDESGMGATASFSTKALHTLRKEINGALVSSMKEAIATLNDHGQELDMIASIYDKGAVKAADSEFVGAVADDAITDAKTAVAEGFKLMSAFVKYARGTKAVVKRAQAEAESMALSEGDTMSHQMDSHLGSDLMDLIHDTEASLGDAKELMHDEEEHEHEHKSASEEDEDLDAEDADMSLSDDEDENDLKMTPQEVSGGGVTAKPGTEIQVVASLDSRQGRAALRAKLAAETLKFSPMLDQAHPKGGTTTQLDVKPTGDLGLVEDLQERHEAMMDVATAPVKIRKEAEAIHKLISEGHVEASDLDALVAEGLDKDAVAYYKKYYAQVDGGSEFASELIKEHAKAALAEELGAYKVKLARAYEMTYDMVARGLCSGEKHAIASQVEEILDYNDASFESLKKVVAKSAPVALRKEAGRMPQVGLLGSGEVGTARVSEANLFEDLTSAFSKSSKRMF